MYFAFSGIDIAQMWADMGKANYWWLSLSVIMGFIAFVSRGLRWNVMLEPMGHKPSGINTVASVIFGYFANLAAPRAGELARCSALNQVEKIPVNTLFGTVILERLVDMLLLLVVMVGTLFLNFELYGNFFYEEIWLGLVGKIESAGGSSSTLWLILLGLVLLVLVLLFLLRNKIRQSSITDKIRSFLSGVGKGIADVRKMRQKGAFFFHTFVIWLMYWGMTYVAFFAIPETSHLGPVDGLFVLVLGGFGMVVPAQGGFGSYHVIVTLGLALVYNIGEPLGPNASADSNPALLFATLIHTSQTLLVLVTGAASLLLLSYKRRKLALNEPPEDSSTKDLEAGTAAG